MANVRTLQDINKGDRLGSICEQELQEKLYNAIKSKAEINDLSEKLQDKYSKRVKAFDRERKGWNRDSLRNNTEIQKLRTYTLQVINEGKRLQNKNTNLTSQLTRSQIFHAKYKAENDIKSKKIRSLESMIKILEENIKSELESKVNQLECLKSEAMSNLVLGGNVEKNTQSEEQSSITKSDDISLDSTDLSKYFIRGKKMDQAEKIDGNISTSTSDEIIELPKNGTEISPKISEGTNINKISEDLTPQTQGSKSHYSAIEIPNTTPYLAQPENYASSLIESHPQISVGGIASSAVASTLMSPLSAYIFLTLLIIAIMWFVILRRDLSIGKKSDRLRDAWAKY